jgi:DNA repair protein RecN (Recombination protein N)
MLRTLSVRNYAIVRDLSVEFDAGLTILSGETGAGKSILVGALNLILGERASTEMVRASEDIAVVEAEICDVPDAALAILRRLEIDTNSDTLMLRREVQARGSSRALINGRMVPLSSLKTIGAAMFDLVGQHQQQYLITVDHHIEFLDSFAGLMPLSAEVSDLFDRRSDAKHTLETLRTNAQRNSEMAELYKFQVREIEQAELSIEEEEALNAEKRVLENADKLRTALGSVADGLAISDNAISVRLSQLEAICAGGSRANAGIES